MPRAFHRERGYRATMTVHDLREMLLSALVRRAGGDRRRWRLALGEIRLHSLQTHPHRNWSVSPSGSVGEVAEVERLIDDVAVRYPIVTSA